MIVRETDAKNLCRYRYTSIQELINYKHLSRFKLHSI